MTTSCHKSSVEDGAAFSSLINGLGGQSLYRALFGQYNFTSLVEYTYVTVSAKNEDGLLGGFASFNDGLSGDLESFDHFLEEIATIVPECSVLNSLVVNFFAYNVKICGPDVGKNILREAFARCPDVNNVFWLCPASAKAPPFMSIFFVEVHVPDPSELFKKVKLFMIRREDFLPQLLVREARVEDNDDLLPILQASNPGILEGQDDFFLADMIQSQDERNKIFVGVSDDKPVGMLATSLDVNAALISRVFDLENFSGLISGGDSVVRQTQLMVLVLGESSIVSSCSLQELSESLGGNYLDASSLPDSSFLDAEAVVNHVCDMPLSASAFCIVAGYPRNENEAKDIVTLLSTAELRVVVVEVQATSVDGDEVDAPEVLGGDDGEELLLDAVEYLRRHFVIDGADGGELRAISGVDWVKVDVGRSAESSGVGTTEVAKKMQEIVDLHQVTLAEFGNDIDRNAVANAFAITLFCVEEGFESRSEDMLRVAFEENPSLEYCLLMLPNDAGSLALTACMSCPRVRPGVSFDQALFLAHRDHLLANTYLRVDRYISSMQASFESFVDTVKDTQPPSILHVFEHSLKELDVPLADNPSEACFVATVQGSIVGVVAVSRRMTTTDDIMWMRQQYLVDDVVNFERHRSRSQAMITHWVMNPVFAKSARYVLREVMRLFQKTLLYYECRTATPPSPEALFDMIPVRPRIFDEQREAPNCTDLAAADTIDDDKSSGSSTATASRKREVSLFLMTKMELCNSKNLVSKRIVVIGGNSSAFSILESFCYAKEDFYSTIYYVSETDNFRRCGEGANTTPFPEQNNLRGSLSVRDCGDPTRSYLDTLGISNRIIIVSGRLTDIDRKSKAVVISDDIALEYDVLIIATATQDSSFKQFPVLSGFHPAANMERGIFGLGNQIVDLAAEEWVLHGGGKLDDDKVLISGGNDNALAALSRLLSLGISSERIVWLTPSVGSVIDIGHVDVNEAAENALHGFNIAIYQGIIEELSLDEEDGSVSGVLIRRKRLDTDATSVTSADEGLEPTATTVEIISESEAKEFVSCKSILFCNNPNSCDIDLFSAIKDCGLVFDGGVVVDKSFKTVDNNIYAVGPYTKYSRRFRHAPKHDRYNARELGEYVAGEVMKAQLNQSTEEHSVCSGRHIVDLPEFRNPKIVEFSLPGGLFCFKSTLPDPYPEALSPEMLRPLTTRCVDPENVTVLKFDPLGILVELIYVGVDPIRSTQLGRLVGLHEALLNSAIYSFEKALIKDWLAFFRAEWVKAVLHDEFTRFRQTLHDPISGEKFVLSLMDTLSEKVMAGASEELAVKAAHQILGDRCAFVPESGIAAVEGPLMDFVKKYKSDFHELYVPQAPNSRAAKK